MRQCICGSDSLKCCKTGLTFTHREEDGLVCRIGDLFVCRVCGNFVVGGIPTQYSDTWEYADCLVRGSVYREIDKDYLIIPKADTSAYSQQFLKNMDKWEPGVQFPNR